MIITQTQILVYFLIFARFSGLIIFSQLFSRREFFTVGRVAFCLLTAALFLFILPPPKLVPSGVEYIVAIAIEILIGYMIGIIVGLMTYGLEYAGAIIDIQSGLSGSMLLDTSTGTQVTVFSMMMRWTAMAIFLSVDGHHMVLASLVNSFQILPLGLVPTNLSQGLLFVAGLGSTLFYMATVFGAAVVLVCFLVDFGFGILNKIAEQINVFSIGFQVKPSIAVAVFVGITPGLVYSIQRALEKVGQDLVEFMMIMQVGP